MLKNQTEEWQVICGSASLKPTSPQEKRQKKQKRTQRSQAVKPKELISFFGIGGTATVAGG